MFKKCGMCLFLVLCIVLGSNCLVYGQGAKAYAFEDESMEIGAIEFYTFLVDSLAPEKIKEPEFVDWCNPQMRVLVDMELIEPIEMVEIEKGYYTAASFVDRGLGLIGYIERPLISMPYVEGIELVLEDIGIRDKFSIDLSKKMTVKEAYDFIGLLKELKKKPIKKLNYTDDDAVINYKIDYFVDASMYYRRMMSSIAKLPQKYIDLLNETGYTMIITDSLAQYAGDNLSNKTSSMMSSDTKTVYFTPLSYFDVYHEIGHVVALDGIPKGEIILNYLYFWEGDAIAKKLNNSYAKSDAHECFACLFDVLMGINVNSDVGKQTLEEFRKVAPKSTHFIYDVIISSETLYDVTLYNNFLKDNKIYVGKNY